MKIGTFSRSAAVFLAASCLSTPASAQQVGGIRGGNTLVIVSSTSPGGAGQTRTITGLGSGQTLVAIDARPAVAGRVLYGLSNTGQIYSINPLTGAASAVGAPIALQGTQFGFDFNPTVDRIRLVSNTGQNLRINPDSGAVTVDGNLNIPVAGQPIKVNGNTAAAYTNNVPGATTTTLYVINTQTGLLQIQNPPNNGTLTVVGGLGGAAAGTVSGFDISAGGQNRVSVIQNGVTNLYSINLQTGAATFIGQFSTGILEGLAFVPDAFASQAGLTGNQQAIAGAFDNFTSVGPGLLSFLTNLDTLDAAARADAFTQLSPEALGILPEAILQMSDLEDGTVRTYLHDVRNGGTPGVSGGAVVDADRGIGGFLVGTGRTGNFEARGGREETDYGSAGVMGGLDLRVGSALVGVSGGYEVADIQLNRFSPSSRAKGWHIGGYGSLGLGPVFVDLVGSYGKADLNLRRNVSFGTFSNQAVADSDSRHYSLSATAGINANLGMVQVEPYVGVRYADVRIDGFSEGTGLTNLTVGEQDVDSLQGVAGVRAGFATPLRTGATLRMRLKGEYRREFENDGSRVISANFNGTGVGAPFVINTTPLGDDYFAVGAGLTIAGDSPVSLVADYVGNISGGYDIHGVQVGLRMRF